MNNRFRAVMMSAGLALAMVAAPADASVVIAGTRVIYPGQEKEVTVQLSNEGQRPALVQAWLDEGDAAAAPETIDVPFTLAPAMFRLDPGKGQALRVLHTGSALRADRESLYWLNVLEVPPKSGVDANRLQLAVRTRIKLIYRPAGLAGKPADAAAAVRWEIVAGNGDGRHALKATNPTPYYVNLAGVALQTRAGQLSAGAGHVAPQATALFPLEVQQRSPITDGEVRYRALNDWGGAQEGRFALGARPSP